MWFEKFFLILRCETIKTKEKMKQQAITDKYVNNNYRIKVYGRTDDGRKVNTLVGCSGLRTLVGNEFFEKFVRRADSSMDDVCVCKLRRGLQVSFYVK